ncbi:protein DOG1-like 4 [Forsythia ovata]|uniref:Protein DOG1-like 4 n=1 Tax=Forsythia ovata TaxID=205694 RepID=A0ABD1UBK5_9LAMI
MNQRPHTNPQVVDCKARTLTSLHNVQEFPLDFVTNNTLQMMRISMNLNKTMQNALMKERIEGDDRRIESTKERDAGLIHALHHLCSLSSVNMKTVVVCIMHCPSCNPTTCQFLSAKIPTLVSYSYSLILITTHKLIVFILPLLSFIASPPNPFFAVSEDVLPFFAPSWLSPLENAYLWITGWKQSIAFELIDPLTNTQNTWCNSSMYETDQQVKKIEALREKIKAEEDTVEKEMELQ